ncbi:MAG: acyl-CoA dehydrogenase family protein [Candidatus Niyogibacteria bacterium]|nr:MAG: acyl-CoA dehydrogenase family protein [Candidatus Niyogibacteria bacterium]
MDFELTAEQKMIQDMAKGFAVTHFAPIVEEYEAQEKCPTHLFQKTADCGFLGINVPQKFGGMGLDSVSQMLIVKELSKVWAGGTLSLIIVPNSLVAYSLAKYGTAEQIEKYLKPLIRGEKHGCFGLTEPNYGSHASGVKTKAHPPDISVFGSAYRINGEKTFITNVTFADFILVLARTHLADKDRPEYDGLTAFIVDIGATCVTKEIKKIGLHSAPFGSIHFKDTFVSEENILSKEGRGFKIFMDTLISGRIFIAAQAWGVAEAAFEDALAYTKERRTFGKLLIDHQVVSHTLADMAMAVKEAEFWTLYAASLKDSGAPDFRKWASAAKTRATESALFCADKNVLIHGGMGYTREALAGRLWQEAKAFEIYEGANPIQKEIIARELKK